MTSAVRLLRVLAVLAASVVVLALPAPAGAAETGVNVVSLSAADGAQPINATGARWVRGFVGWNVIEPNGPDRWSADQVAALDQLTASAREHGQKVVLVVSGAPQWANGSTDALVPPRDVGDYGRFLRSLSARYRGLVAAWEIWNEPDGTEFWHGGEPSPAAYAPLLTAAFKGIREGDPSALVLAAPSTGNDYPFLEGLYQAGAGRSFDGVAVHTDTACLVKPPNDYYRENGRIGRFSFLGFREVHEVLAANGDAAKPILMTELGWSATQTRCARGASAGKKAAGVTEAQQAANLKLAYRCLSFYPYVIAGLWFNSRDVGPQDTELNRYGLLRWDGSKRPAWEALSSVSRTGPPTTGECGDFRPPDIRVHEPASGAWFDRSLGIRVSASDVASKLGRISLYANGRRIRSFTEDLANDRSVGLEWMGARELPFGAVTVTAEALDEFGNVTTREIPVQRVDPLMLPPQRTAFRIKLSGQGLKRKVSGQLKALGPFQPGGKVRIEWQYRRGGRWVTLHKKTKNANREFRYPQKLRKAGRWRVRVSFQATKPFRAASATKSFRAR